MERTNFLALPKRPATDFVGVPRPPRTLPKGVPPMYERLQINAKVPRIWHPDDSIVVSRGDLTEKLIQEYPNKEFDESDIYEKNVPKDFNGLHDPYLSHYFWTPEVYEHLIGQKLITPDGRVKCSLKELNEYREYLHRLWAMEANQLRRQQVEEVKEMLRILRKVEPTPEEKKTLEELAEKHRLFDHDPPYDLDGEILRKLHREQKEFLRKPTEEMCLAERRLRAKKRAAMAQNRNIKELEDWLYDQSQFLRTFDAANYAKKKARDDRLMGRWEAHNKEAARWLEEEEKLRKQNEADRLRAMAERDRQIQDHRDRQKRRLEDMNTRRKNMVEKQYEAVKKRFEKWKAQLAGGALASTPKSSRVGETLEDFDQYFAREKAVDELKDRAETTEDYVSEEPVEGQKEVTDERGYAEQRAGYKEPISELTTGDLLTSTDSTKEGEGEPFRQRLAIRKSGMFDVERVAEEEVKDYKPGEESGYYEKFMDPKITRSTTGFVDALVSGVFTEVTEVRDYKPGKETGNYTSYINSKTSPSTTAFVDVLVSGVYDEIDREIGKKPDLKASKKVETAIRPSEVREYKPGKETGSYTSYISSEISPSTTAFVDVVVSGVYDEIDREIGKKTDLKASKKVETAIRPSEVREYQPGKETGSYTCYISSEISPSTTAFVDVLVSGVYDDLDDKKEQTRGTATETKESYCLIEDESCIQQTGSSTQEQEESGIQQTESSTQEQSSIPQLDVTEQDAGSVAGRFEELVEEKPEDYSAQGTPSDSLLRASLEMEDKPPAPEKSEEYYSEQDASSIRMPRESQQMTEESLSSDGFDTRDLEQDVSSSPSVVQESLEMADESPASYESNGTYSSVLGNETESDRASTSKDIRNQERTSGSALQPDSAPQKCKARPSARDPEDQNENSKFEPEDIYECHDI